MKRVNNYEVARAWSESRAATSHTGNLSTDGKEIYSYSLQVGDTTEDGKKILKDFTARGSYGFRSMTTSKHVGMLRYIPDADQQPIVV